VSTFLLSLGVIAATIGVVLRVALSDSDQPATIRRQPSRTRAPRLSPPTVSAHAPAVPTGTVKVSGSPALSMPDAEMRLRMLPASPTTVWVRIRSAGALVVLVAVLGALLAVAIAGMLVGIAFLIRSATA